MNNDVMELLDELEDTLSLCREVEDLYLIENIIQRWRNTYAGPQGDCSA